MHCLLSSFLPTYGMFIMCYFLYSSLCSDHPTLYFVSSPLDLSPSFIHFSYYVHHSCGRTRNVSYPSLDAISEQIVLYGQLLLKTSTINDSKPRSFQSNQDTKCPLVSSLWIGSRGMSTLLGKGTTHAARLDSYFFRGSTCVLYFKNSISGLYTQSNGAWSVQPLFLSSHFRY